MRYAEQVRPVPDKRDVAAGCSRCGVCRVHCAFLKEYGTPGEIAGKVAELPHDRWPDPFECSLCGLCGAVCPEGVKPETLFLNMRRTIAGAGELDLKPYWPVLSFEKRGASNLFSLIKLPEGGTTAFFPGCALPGAMPGGLRRLFEALRNIDPHMGVALGCCMKPSHDLGRQRYFEEKFGVLQAELFSAGVRRVLTACPNCQKIFKEYGKTIRTSTVYEYLAEAGFEPEHRNSGEAVIHDPCPQRYDAVAQDSVRRLARACGITVEDPSDARELTRCCGEGGMVKFVRPQFANKWTEERIRSAGGRRMVTSCSGCTNYLDGPVPVHHILDLLFNAKRRKLLRTPLNYVARLLLKQWFKKNIR